MKIELINFIDNFVHFVTKDNSVEVQLGPRTLGLDFLKNLEETYLNYLPHRVSIVVFISEKQAIEIELKRRN